MRSACALPLVADARGRWRLAGLLAALSLLRPACASPPPHAAELEAGFQNPPAAARPYVWWHWMDGNVTQDGIRRDLEWMHAAGIGGFEVIDVSMGIPPLVSPLAPYGSAEWKDDLRFAVHTASALGLEVAISSAPGFSESGGPWVRPEEGMKKVVWSVARAAGGRRFAARLAEPPSVPGPFQNMPIDRTSLTAGAAPSVPLPHLYQDIGVIAYRLPDADVPMDAMRIDATASGGGVVDAPVLWDGDLTSAVSIPLAPDGSDAWLQLSLRAPQTIKSITISVPTGIATPFISDFSKPIARVEASTDGKRFFAVCDVAASIDVQHTIAFPAVTALAFRLTLARPVAAANPLLMTRPTPTAHRVAEFVLHTVPRVDHVEEKAGYFTPATWQEAAPAVASASDAVRTTDIVDLTSRMAPDGTLRWTPPQGRWEILRFGYSLEGTTNHPVGPGGTGLEMDKLNAVHVRNNFVRYLDSITAVVGADFMGRHGVQALLNDSWEAGAENWTEGFAGEFAKRRGYSLLPWLPALTGRIIGGAAATERVLWDFRQTLGELLAENHYQVMAQELHRRGMIHYVESHESGRAFVGDGMAVKRFADVPTGAMWAGGLGPQPDMYDADLRETASVAHLYGRPLVAAESFTGLGNWFASTPAKLKPLADRELADGVNRFMVHASAHQPLNDAGPGVTLGPFGQWFTRKETWADQARAWTDYLARSSHLLQQGTPVADILYLYGEDSNVTALYANALPKIPAGYAFDFIDREALDLLSVRDGRLTAAPGAEYRLLVLDPRCRLLSLPVLRKLRSLVLDGGTLVGAKPVATPSFADDPREFDRLVADLWGSVAAGASDAAMGVRRVGRGRVIDAPLAAALPAAGLEPDVAFPRSAPPPPTRFAHRRLDAGDIYFLSNTQETAVQSMLSFRTAGRVPELWHAENGRIEAVSYRMEDGRTTVPITLAPAESVFVVFRRASAATSLRVPATVRTSLATVTGEWDQRFAQRVRHAGLRSWSEDADPGIRYFSGTATYVRSIQIPAAWLDGKAGLELDLGEVRNLAQVVLNGRSLGTLWHSPFRIDLGGAVHAGSNKLEIRVTNTWVNRLIGDRQPDAARKAFTTFNPYRQDSPLPESGLLGPVSLNSVHE